MRRPNFLAVLAAPAVAVLLWPQPGALAAPQVLALLATDGPVQLRCQGEACVAELASMCLQPDRRAPEAGRAYRALSGGDVRLVGRASDGSDLLMPLPADARISALRTHVALALSVPKAWIDRHFAALRGVDIPEDSPLAPVPAAGDFQPMTGAELEVASTRLLKTAEAVFLDDPVKLAAVRVARRMINALPPSGTVDDAALAAAWREAAGAPTGSVSDPSHLSLARINYEFCRYGRADGLYGSARDCLQALQDGAVESLHNRYVETLSEANAGS